MLWLKRKLFPSKPPTIPWYAYGYIAFPPETDQIAIVMRNGHIVRINNDDLKLTIERTTATGYLTEVVVEYDI